MNTDPKETPEVEVEVEVTTTNVDSPASSVEEATINDESAEDLLLGDENE